MSRGIGDAHLKHWVVADLNDTMTRFQDAQKAAQVTLEVTERELELEAQLVEARSIIQEQVPLLNNIYV